MNNTEETNKFLEKYYLPKRNQEEIENTNRPISSTKTEMVIKKNLPTKAQGPILQCSVFFIIQISHPYMTSGKTIDLTTQALLAK